jgi:hypothetical protein
MINVNIDNVKDNSFTGHVYCEDLNPKQIEQLGLIITDCVQEIDVKGELSVNIDSDQYIEVCIENLTLFHNGNEIELEENDYNYDNLCYQLETGIHVADWIVDIESGLIDYYYDTMGDR